MEATAEPGRNPDNELDAKAAAYADALILALTETAKRLGAPDINAALAALAYAEGYLLSSLGRKDRIEARRALIDRMDKDTAAFVNARLLAETEPAGRG